jgi:hypothetical protein
MIDYSMYKSDVIWCGSTSRQRSNGAYRLPRSLRPKGGVALKQGARPDVTTVPAPNDPDTRRPTVCIEQYAPVCGRLSNVVKTYSNQCYARAAGAEVIAQGPCADPALPPGPQ